MGFEPKTPTFGRLKTAPRALACRATVIGKLSHFTDLSIPFTVVTCAGSNMPALKPAAFSHWSERRVNVE